MILKGLSLANIIFKVVGKLLDWRKERAIKQAERDKISKLELQEIRRNTARAKSALGRLADPKYAERLRQRGDRSYKP